MAEGGNLTSIVLPKSGIVLQVTVFIFVTKLSYWLGGTFRWQVYANATQMSSVVCVYGVNEVVYWG